MLPLIPFGLFPSKISHFPLSQGIFGNFQGTEGGTLVNAISEVSFAVTKGAFSGGVSGGLAALFRGGNINEGIAIGMRNGAMGGAVQTGLNIAMFGTTYKPDGDYGGRTDMHGPAFRRGTFITRQLFKPGSGVTLGRTLVTNKFRTDVQWLHRDTGKPDLEFCPENVNSQLTAHEYNHWNQIVKNSWGSFYARWFKEGFNYGFNKSYDINGTLECESRLYQENFNTY